MHITPWNTGTYAWQENILTMAWRVLYYWCPEANQRGDEMNKTTIKSVAGSMAIVTATAVLIVAILSVWMRFGL